MVAIVDGPSTDEQIDEVVEEYLEEHPVPSGQPRYSGMGPPGIIIGAHPDDEYMDTLTGDIYKLM